jgi:hypothetical protein
MEFGMSNRRKRSVWLKMLMSDLVDEIKNAVQKKRNSLQRVYTWTAALLIVALVAFFGLYAYAAISSGIVSLPEYIVSLSAEYVGIILTVLLVQQLVSYRDRRQYRQRLTRHARSRENALAIQAVRELAAEGWLFDGSLKGCTLSGANLENAELKGARLPGVDLSGANLHNADLRSADLRASELAGADLQGANLYGARLFEARLYQYDGEYNGIRCRYQFSILELAEKHREEQPGTELVGATFDSNSVLPNNENWRTAADLDEFVERDSVMMFEPGSVKAWVSREYEPEGVGPRRRFKSRKAMEEYAAAQGIDDEQ